MDQNPIVQEMVDKTFREMNEPKKPLERSRMAISTNGYIHLIGWSNAQLLRIVVRVFTSSLPKSEYRLKAQLDDAARSVIANIEEGFRRPTTTEYITFLGYSQASLIEVKGDIQRALQDRFLYSKQNSCLADIGINLSKWHEAVKQSVISKPLDSKGNYRNLEEPKLVKPLQNSLKSLSPAEALAKEGKFLYSPVDNLTAGQLTYEMFIELINKTDWHLRRLVVSLEEKLNRDRQFYQVEKARVRGNAS
jgi:four helix bundle protein